MPVSPSVDSPSAAALPTIAVVAGPTATILNSDPLVTSQKARAQHGLPPARDWQRRPVVADALHFQRLAAPVTVYIEAFTAHPLEGQSAALCAPPDGYVDAAGKFHRERHSLADRPVFAVTLDPADGLYPLPYMARRADGSAWERHSPAVGPDGALRQTFLPDAARLVEEIERTASHLNGNLSARARFSFLRAAPSGGLPGETPGADFFPYGYHEHFPSRAALATITNTVQRTLAAGEVRGLIWLEGSPRIEDTLYWLQLVIDTDCPIVGAAAQRPNHRLGADGPAQFVDAVDYVLSDVWRDAAGRNRAGAVLVQDQRIFGAREVSKIAGRPGGFAVQGGHGGVLGTTSPLQLTHVPARRHGRGSTVRLSQLPSSVKSDDGALRADAIPHVEIVSLPGWMAHGGDGGAIAAQVASAATRALAEAPLAGLVAEGVTGGHFETAEVAALEHAAARGLPIVKVGRGAPESFVPASVQHLWIGGGNLTATKARVLLMACLLRFGRLPPAADPARPTPDERAALRSRLADYQAVFDTH